MEQYSPYGLYTTKMGRPGFGGVRAGLDLGSELRPGDSRGRVLDPETGLDQVSNVGILGGRITRVSTEPLTGTRTIDARGLVVAPGFIDLHQHGQDEASGVLKAFDGVTSALEMEIGSPDVKAFLTRKTGHSIIGPPRAIVLRVPRRWVSPWDPLN